MADPATDPETTGKRPTRGFFERVKGKVGLGWDNFCDKCRNNAEQCADRLDRDLPDLPKRYIDMLGDLTDDVDPQVASAPADDDAVLARVLGQGERVGQGSQYVREHQNDPDVRRAVARLARDRLEMVAVDIDELYYDKNRDLEGIMAAFEEARQAQMAQAPDTGSP